MQDIINATLDTKHFLKCSTYSIARNGEGLAPRFSITIPAGLCTYWAYIDFKKPNGEIFKTPRLDVVNGKIEYDIPSAVLDVEGELEVQLVFQNDKDKIWKSYVKAFAVRYSINATDDIPNKEDFVQYIEQKTDEALEIAQSVEERANNGEFDGEKGDKGDKGDDYVLTETDKSEIAGKVPTHEKYFDISPEGYVSLKPEYRGAYGFKMASSDEPPSIFVGREQFAISDMGAGNVGSKNHELPEHLIVPPIINGIAFDTFQNAAFAYNTRIKKITLPKGAKFLSNGTFYRAYNLEELENTKAIEILPAYVFCYTALKKAEFPNLKSSSSNSDNYQLGKEMFIHCTQLESVNIGKVTKLGNYAFGDCQKLMYVETENKMTSIGEGAFFRCGNLRTIDNLIDPDVTTEIKTMAFVNCRADYDWDKLTKCTFGVNATSKQLHSTKFWEGVSFTPCLNRTLGFLNQGDMRWRNVEFGNGYNFYDGCTFMSLMGIYCSLYGANVDDARDFLTICANAGIDLDNYGWKNTESESTSFLDSVFMRDAYEKLGLEPTFIKTPLNASKLETLYNALADGKYALTHTFGNPTNDPDNHAVAITGIYPTGELLIQNSSDTAWRIGITDPAKMRIPIQNLTESFEESANSFTTIVILSKANKKEA